MGQYANDQRIVLTLDAGGTNMVFGAMRGEKGIGGSVTLPSNAHDLDRCLQTMVDGFTAVRRSLPGEPAAISFAFPGPADYPNGIIGGYLPNFPSFRDGVALGPFLEDRFGVPVFINNDGDLYAYGEALGGALPEVNARLASTGSAKRYRNLIGYTFGTGFGVGCVIDGRLNRGDNSCVETFCLPHSRIPGVIVEDGVAVRAVRRVYGEWSGDLDSGLTPKDIFDIAEGTRPGNPEAARAAFAELGAVAGDAMAVAAQLIDGLIVIGGGITASCKYFMPSLLAALRGTVRTLSGDTLSKVQMNVYDLDDEAGFAAFARGGARQLRVYGSDRTVTYDPEKRIGVMISRIGASQAIALGACAFALTELDKHSNH